VVEGDFGDAEGSESVGFSHGELGLVVEALDDAAGELFSGAEIIEDEFAVAAQGCYSGVFIPRLARPDAMVMTAADAQHPSFGCEDRAKWTYFDDAFFNVALRRADNLQDAVPARSCVSGRPARGLLHRTHKWPVARMCSR
jgi:hypothetical protein